MRRIFNMNHPGYTPDIVICIRCKKEILVDTKQLLLACPPEIAMCFTCPDCIDNHVITRQDHIFDIKYFSISQHLQKISC